MASTPTVTTVTGSSGAGTRAAAADVTAPEASPTRDVRSAGLAAGGANGERLALAGRRLDSVEASDLTLERSATRVARGTTVRLDRSASAITLGRDVHLQRSAAALSIGGKVVVEQGASQWLIGGLVQAKRIFAVAVIAGKVEGQVRCLFDAKGALAFGAGVALMSTLLRLLLGKR